MPYVYRLVANFVCPFTGMEGHPDRTTSTTTVFATREVAEDRVEKFKGMIRAGMKLGADYPIEVEVVPMEVIEE